MRASPRRPEKALTSPPPLEAAPEPDANARPTPEEMDAYIDSLIDAVSLGAPPDAETRPAPEERDRYLDGLAEAALFGAPPDAPPRGPGDLDPELAAARRTKDFSFQGRRVLAKVVDVYDGDTLRLVFRLAGELAQFCARMEGYDSPEMKPPKASPTRLKEKEAARAAKAALIRWLGRDCIVYAECGPFDKYGRILVSLYRPAGSAFAENGENLNAWMISNGHGRPYDGGTKTPFAPPQV